MTNKAPDKKPVNQYMQYAGMAFQLIVILLAAAYAGDALDKKYGGEKGYFTAGLVTFFLIGYLIKVYYDLTRKKVK